MLNVARVSPRPHRETISPPGAPPAAAADLDLAFGRGGAAARHCVSGWSDPEETEIWSIGPLSRLVLPAPPSATAGGMPHMLVLHLRPHVVEGKLPAQRLRVRANGIEIGAFTLARRTTRACLIPAAALRGRDTVELTFETPDAARPSDLGAGRDNRPLAVALSALRLYPDRFAPRPGLGLLGDDEPIPVDIAAVMRADRMPLAELMQRFESIGQNCEFGLVQRRCGAEPLGLLRFASTPLPNLLAALDAGFAGMGTPDTVRAAPSPNGRELMVTDTRYGIVYHAWVKAGEMTTEAVGRREARRVPLLARKLLEDLEAGEKIFVFKGMGALADEAVFPLAAALRRHGPNTLLALTLADDTHRAGTVEARAPGFLIGYLDRFAPGEDAHDFLLEQWVAVCRAAYRMTHAVQRAAA
jgi:hypothetical protein